MSRLAKRIEKLERGNRHFEIVVSTQRRLTGEERAATAKEHLRANNLLPETRVVVMDALAASF